MKRDNGASSGKEEPKTTRWRKVTQNVYRKRPTVGPLVTIQLYEARGAILLGVDWWWYWKVGFVSLSSKIHLPDPEGKTDEESSSFLGDTNIPAAGHVLPQYQHKKIPCQFSCYTDDTISPRVQHKLCCFITSVSLYHKLYSKYKHFYFLSLELLKSLLQMVIKCNMYDLSR